MVKILNNGRKLTCAQFLKKTLQLTEVIIDPCISLLNVLSKILKSCVSDTISDQVMGNGLLIER